MAMGNGRVYAGGTPNFDFRTGKTKPVPQRKPVPPGGKTPMAQRPDRVTTMPVGRGPAMKKPAPPSKKPGVVRRPGTITQRGATSKPKKTGRYM